MNVATCLNHVEPHWVELPALMDEHGHVMKRGALQSLVMSMVQHLVQAGVKRGDLVGLATLGHDQYIITTLAIAALGAVSMPLPKLPHLEQKMTGHCRFVIGRLANSDPKDDATHLDFPNAEALANPPAVESVKLFDEAGLFRISHSSGTTGTPKAVAISHEEQTQRLRQRSLVMPIQPGQSLLLMMGLDAEVTMTYVLYVLARGGALIIPGGNGGAELLRTLENASPNYVLSSPHIWAGVVQAASERHYTPNESKPVIFLAGGKPDEATVTGSVNHFNAILMSDYGSSETGMLSVNRFEKMDKAWSYAGKLLPGVQCDALDPETYAALPKGKVGILSFKVPGMVSHYWNAPEYDRRFFHGGWFSTGDLGCVDEKGFLFVGVRVSRIVNRKGVKFDLDMLEKFLTQLPYIKENAWIKIEQIGVEKLILFVVIDQSSNSAKESKTHIKQALGERYAPDQMVFIEKLPRTGSGKINRDRLLELMQSSTSAAEKLN
ncbi:hypothetical protein B9Z47_02655 [Limnohabitans sp. 2KL-1]|uniref:class I adenylate-forming enzyme family protein n=1 Tax=Limnohabitans sp. 2KL-1 TaxID=1100699 RepID=UPI000D3D1E77|nr:class I adenylate-forming enzyme family protein [Limnohabitans sp. 2KL-1]PUE50668.1 hypothetical protein B9Z47_02655 [Limnohabitans sp. 2KL-1]